MRHAVSKSAHNTSRRMRYVLLLCIVLAGAGAAAVALFDQPLPVEAKSSYLAAARAEYPHINGTSLASCSLCHTGVPNLNPYGADYQSHGHNFAAIELLDSDNDGFDNITEINALTMPGDAGSKPSDSPTNTPVASPTATTTPIPPAEGEYKLIGWNDLGMHCMNESFEDLAVLPPFNTLWAQLIRQGPEPEIVAEGVTIEYEIIDNTYSAGKTDFWDYVQPLFGVDLPDNVGLTGATLSGTMHAEEDHFVTEGIPLTPYRDSAPDTQYPYQLAHLVAKDSATGEILAETTTVAPVSTEMHCDTCHADGMQEEIATGKVETNILALHDEEEDTDLMGSRPVLCAGCHGSNALGMPGNPNLPSLSHAMHSKHAPEDEDEDDGDDDEGDAVNHPVTMDSFAQSDDIVLLLNRVTGEVGPSPILTDEGTENCYLCHPGEQTQCLRGTMYASGMTCADCHGSMRDVADPAREPWVDEPRCGDCHGEQYAEEPGKLYRNSKGHGDVYCEACHGTPHAILPSTQPNDNLQNIALQGHAGTLSECTVCHAEVPDGPGPHGAAPDAPDPDPTATPTPGDGDDEGYVKIYGTIEALPAGGLIGTWTVSGWTVSVDAGTVIDAEDGPVTGGAYVEVKGQQTGDHQLDAIQIEVKESDEGENDTYIVFTGTITSPSPCHPPATCDWTVNDGVTGVTVHVNAGTRVEQEHGPVAQGATVEIRGWQQADGSIMATKVEVEESEDGEGGGGNSYVKFNGTVQSIPASLPGELVGTWTDNGYTVMLTAETEIEEEHGPLAAGVFVEIKGWQQAGTSTVTAREIEVKASPSDDDGGDDGDEIKIYGTIIGPDPLCTPPMPTEGCSWQVRDDFGNTYTVNAGPQTEIEEEHGALALNVYVSVEGRLQGDGVIAAEEVEVKSEAGDGNSVGYVKFYGVVEGLPAVGLIGEWTVSGRLVHVSAATDIEEEDGTVRIGANVEVKGTERDDGSVDAASIEVKS